MATTKKAAPKKTASKASTTRKPATTRKAPVVSETVKKAAPTKAASSRKKTSSAAKTSTKHAQLHSFRVTRDNAPFTSFRITKQTVYWIILVAFIIFAQLWILKLQVDVASLLDQQQTQLQNM